MSRRRYKIDKNPTYDQTFDRLKGDSPVLNPERFGMNEAILLMSHMRGLEGLLYALLGDEDREFVNDFGTRFPARVPGAELVIKSIEADFEAMKQAARNMGRPEPSEMPAELNEKILKAEARLDIYGEEADWLQKTLDEFVERKQEKDDARVLKYGPQGTGKGEPLRELDGQDIATNGDGVLYINDKRSPYHLMKVIDYRTYVSAPFLASRSKIVLDKHGKEIKVSTRGRALKREHLPKWPTGVKKVARAKK
jgi:hypothetical protein